jgi:hypothetical protein
MHGGTTTKASRASGSAATRVQRRTMLVTVMKLNMARGKKRTISSHVETFIASPPQFILYETNGHF